MTEDETVRLGSITNSMDVDLSKVWESEGQRSLACCSPWNRKESDTTERLKNNKDNNLTYRETVLHHVNHKDIDW